MNTSRRKFLNLGNKSLIAGLLSCLSYSHPKSANAIYPYSAFNSKDTEKILLEVFGTTEAGHDGSINITVPRQTTTPKVVPFSITAPGADLIALILNNHSNPLIMVAELKQNKKGRIFGVLTMERSAELGCYALREGQLQKNSRFIMISEKFI